MANEEVKPGEEIVRVLRVIEYVGPRVAVENSIKNSITGSKTFGSRGWKALGPNNVTVTVCTLGTFPEILHKADADAWMLAREIEGPPPLPSEAGTVQAQMAQSASNIASGLGAFGGMAGLTNMYGGKSK